LCADQVVIWQKNTSGCQLLLRKALAKMRKAGHKRAHDMHIETAVGYDRTAPKRAINVSLNDDLVRQARLYTRNLSGTLEDLLQDFVERERARRRAEDVAVNQVIDGLNAFHLTHGLLSDEFSSL
jgi:antitoxin CcdA